MSLNDSRTARSQPEIEACRISETWITGDNVRPDCRLLILEKQVSIDDNGAASGRRKKTTVYDLFIFHENVIANVNCIGHRLKPHGAPVLFAPACCPHCSAVTATSMGTVWPVFSETKSMESILFSAWGFAQR